MACGGLPGLGFDDQSQDAPATSRPSTPLSTRAAKRRIKERRPHIRERDMNFNAYMIEKP
ncbi:hypothetical protein DZK27_07200 [Rhodobacteraceae bacterium 63075]|nr:hypothetical protein DZK27_07200 [Rhodobacteraceae bacterium 63075]